MAEKQDPNSLGAMMAAQNELTSINASRLQNSQAEQAFLQQQQAANAVMMQAAQIGTSDSLGQQVGGMNPQTQAILAQYGITGSAPMPGKQTSTSKTTSSGGNVKIENNTTTNNEVKIVNTGGSSGDSGNQTKFQVWLSNVFAKQNQEYEIQRRIFARRDRDLEKQSNKMMRSLEKTTAGLSERLNPETWQKSQGNLIKFIMKILLLTAAPALIKPIAEGLEKLKDGIKSVFLGESSSSSGSEKTSVFENLGKILGSGFQRIIDKLDLMKKDRANAINSVKKPSGNFTGNVSSWLEYVGNLITAGFSGSKGLVNIENRSIENEAEKFTSGVKTRPGEKIRSNTSGYTESELVSGNYRNIMLNEDFTLTGGIKNDLNSHLAFSGTITSMANNTEGIGYSASIKSLMTKAKKSVTDKNGIILGSETATIKFLSIFGVKLKDFLEKGLVKSHIIYYFDKSKNKTILDFLENWRAESIIPTDFDEKFNIRDVITLDLKAIKKILNYRINVRNTSDDLEPMTHEEYLGYLQKFGQPSSGSIKSLKLYELTKDGIKALETRVGGEHYSFEDTSPESYDLLHNVLEEYSGKSLTRDVSTDNLEAAERQHSSYLNSINDIEGRDDAIGAVMNKVNYMVTKSIDKLWNRDSSIIGGDNSGRYSNTPEGEVNFANDLMTLYTKELTSYYKDRGLSEEDSHKKASMIAQWLTGQDAMETDWGHKIIGNYNYGNIKKGSWKGKTVKDSTYNEDWRSYDSPEDYIRDKLSTLSLKRYNDVLMSNTLEEFTEKLQKGGYSASDTPLQYHNKVAGLTDSVQRRLTKNNWKESSPKAEENPEISNSQGGFNSYTVGNAVISIKNKTFSDLNNNIEDSFGGINILNENGTQTSLRTYYKNYSGDQISLIEQDIRNEAKRGLMYESSPSKKYSEYNTNKDIHSQHIFLGWFSDLQNFGSYAKNCLTDHNPGKSPRIGYNIYLTKDLKSWRRIETTNYFNVTVSDKLGKLHSINSGKVLYDKDLSFPNEWYEYTGIEKKSGNYKNPIMSILFVDLTPNARAALQDLINTANKNIRVNEGTVEIEKNGSWEKASGMELSYLSGFGFISPASQDLNNPTSGYTFTPEYRNYIESSEALNSSFSNYRQNPLLPNYTFDPDNPVRKILNPAIEWGQDKLNKFNTNLGNLPFVRGFKAGRSGETDKSSEATTTTNSDGAVFMSNSGNTTYTDNRTITQHFYNSNETPNSLTNQ